MMAIDAKDLRRTFDVGRGRNKTQVEAVRGIDLLVPTGQRLAFIGPNGAGKSTSIKMLTGILRPSSGTASVLGLEPWSQRRELARRIGTLFGQRSMLWQELAPRESFRMLGAIHGMDTSSQTARISELADLLDAGELFDQPVRTMSLGQRMKAELAACLLHNPPLLFLDEPTIGLDLVAKQRFRELLVRLNEQQNTTILLTSHDVADIEQVAQRAVIVNHGAIIYDGNVADMRRNLLRTRCVEATLRQPLASPPLLPAGATLESMNATDLAVVVDTGVTSIRTVLDALLSDDAVAEVTVSDPPLEAVIASIYELHE
jgi:ABC-2 type transport system ATP-binding protein